MRNFQSTMNAVGLSITLIGSFLLRVEALRVAKVARLATTFAQIAETLTDTRRTKRPLPLTWRFALSCAILCVVIWLFARVATSNSLGLVFALIFLVLDVSSW